MVLGVIVSIFTYSEYFVARTVFLSFALINGLIIYYWCPGLLTIYIGLVRVAATHSSYSKDSYAI